ncbi:Hypp166 [Branchiostoma lanceolatum]|uniref:Hypp166 protein n=1 Tax=Branchiostoma lanceolatum TaxID=7740 RepID=A0A8J9WBT5_BRALA|nr:Hypp166 [Branchiostoma lanceolatum]
MSDTAVITQESTCGRIDVLGLTHGTRIRAEGYARNPPAGLNRSVTTRDVLQMAIWYLNYAEDFPQLPLRAQQIDVGGCRSISDEISPSSGISDIRRDGQIRTLSGAKVDIRDVKSLCEDLGRSIFP